MSWIYHLFSSRQRKSTAARQNESKATNGGSDAVLKKDEVPFSATLADAEPGTTTLLVPRDEATPTSASHLTSVESDLDSVAQIPAVFDNPEGDTQLAGNLSDKRRPSSDRYATTPLLPLMQVVTHSSLKDGYQNSSRAMADFQDLVSFVANHRKILDNRIKAEDLRKTLSEKLAELREANNLLARLLQAFQATPSDGKLRDRLLKQSYVVRAAQDHVGVAGEQSEEAESRLVEDEWELFNSLPEILQNDNELEETASILRQRGIEFRGSYSLIPESTAETMGRPSEAEDDSEARLVDSELQAIRLLEDEIVTVGERRATLLQAALLNLNEDPEATARSDAELDNFDEQEQALKENLKSALSKLESLRRYDPEVNSVEQTDVLATSNVSLAVEAFSLDQSEATKERSLAATPRSQRLPIDQSLFKALRRLLRSPQMREIRVFPSSLLEDDKSGRAEPFDLINSWLFHRLRVSDDALRNYVSCLTKRSTVSLDLSPQEILNHGLKEWHQDITFKVSLSEYPHNTTNMTLKGDSRYFSNAASMYYQPGHREISEPPQQPSSGFREISAQILPRRENPRHKDS